MTVIRLGNNRYEGLTADTKPTNVAVGSIFRDTQLDLTYKFNGTTWDLIEVAETAIGNLNNKISDNEIGWVKVNKSGATATIRETLGYGFSGNTVRTASSIKINGDLSANGQGVFGHALGVAFNVKRVRTVISLNSKTGTTTVRLYRDSTQVNSWDITAGSTTEIDTGVVTYAYTGSEKIDVVYDSSAGGTTLSITFVVYVDIEKTVSLT